MYVSSAVFQFTSVVIVGFVSLDLCTAANRTNNWYKCNILLKIIKNGINSGHTSLMMHSKNIFYSIELYNFVVV